MEGFSSLDMVDSDPKPTPIVMAPVSSGSVGAVVSDLDLENVIDKPLLSKEIFAAAAQLTKGSSPIISHRHGPSSSEANTLDPVVEHTRNGSDADASKSKATGSISWSKVVSGKDSPESLRLHFFPPVLENGFAHIKPPLNVFQNEIKHHWVLSTL